MFRAVCGGAPSHGPIHVQIQSADIGFSWDPVHVYGLDRVCLISPEPFVSVSSLLFWMLGILVSVDFGKRAGFRGVKFWDLKCSLQLHLLPV